MLGVSQSRGLKLFGREIIFGEFQRMWSRYLNVTDGQTDRRHAISSPRSALASRGKKQSQIFKNEKKVWSEVNSSEYFCHVLEYEVRWETVSVSFVEFIDLWISSPHELVNMYELSPCLHRWPLPDNNYYHHHHYYYYYYYVKCQCQVNSYSAFS